MFWAKIKISEPSSIGNVIGQVPYYIRGNGTCSITFFFRLPEMVMIFAQCENKFGSIKI